MKKILIVDDSETVRSQLQKDLSSAGFEVVQAVDGHHGIEQAKAHKPAFILCDLNMPKMDGLSMVQELKRDPLFKDVPVFMLTTEASPEIKAKAKEIGIRAWITKPYDSAKLIIGIKKVLNL